MEGCGNQILRKIRLSCPEIKKISLAICKDRTTDEVIEKAVNELEIPWDGRILRDCYGAPYLPEWERCQETVSISAADDRGIHICLAAVHDIRVAGLGVDLGFTEEFKLAFQNGIYQGGSLFTKKELQTLDGRENEEGPGQLTCLFTGKEAAFKAMNRSIREKIPYSQSTKFKAEFRDFEILQNPQGDLYARAGKKTGITAEYLGILEIRIFTQQYQDMHITAAACYSSCKS